MDTLSALGIALGASWVSGLRLYGCVATLGLLHKYGGIQLPGNLIVLSEPWVIGVASVLFIVEFVADKVPVVDTVWDTVHTFVRIPAGAVIAWAAFAHTEPAVQVVAFLLGGGVAFTAHGTKATTRAIANTSPEPVSNMALSFAEDGLTAAGLALAVWVPVAAVILVTVAVVASVVILPRVVKRIGRSLKPTTEPSQSLRE